ncbi:hypothetical protein QE152_g7853 [Popillia japonica]|uniref:Uncharacterized protein n=1 Tax=Popillia japonica TaxID=7064 RepID=A0AAW1M8S4_POPJA
MYKLAREYVGRATVHDLKKNRKKIEERVKTMDCGLEKRKTLRAGDCPKMGNAIYRWLLQDRSNSYLWRNFEREGNRVLTENY